MFDREMRQELKALRGIYGTLAEEMTWKELGDRAGLCYSTLINFFSGKTKNPSFRTVYSIGRAVGIKVTLDGNSIRLRNAA